MAEYEETSPKIGEIIENIKKETGVQDENFIKTMMYHQIFSKDKPTLEEYLTLENSEDAMLGSWRGYVLFVHKKLITAVKSRNSNQAGGLKRKRKNKKSRKRNMGKTMKRSRKGRKTQKQGKSKTNRKQHK